MKTPQSTDSSASAENVEVLIVGSGFSGLCMGIKLREAGYRSFVILDKAASVGGTWRENHYPGCACDVPSHLYSFSFEQNPHWTRMFAPQQEILTYLEHCADKYGLREHLLFNMEVTETRWDERLARWTIRTSAGRTFIAKHVVFGLGAFNRPAYPDIKGLETFQGKVFHSAHWDHSYDLKDKRVAVIGTGASAIQIIPELTPIVRELKVMQRTPAWVLPKPDRAISSKERSLYAQLPSAQRMYRYFIYWMMEARALGFTVDPRIMKLGAVLGRAHIRKQIKDKTLREKLTPTYLPGCKRVLISNDYYPALAQPHVDVVTSSIEQVNTKGIRTADGQQLDLDAIVLATGFKVADVMSPLEVYGIDGANINDAWNKKIEAYFGTTVSGFPNCYMLMGPNTGLGHNSMVFMIEAQVRHALEQIQAVDALSPRAFINPRPAAQHAYNKDLERRLAHSVWSSGCQSWYLGDKGHNSTTWPGSTPEFWLRMRLLKQHGYDLEVAGENAEHKTRNDTRKEARA